MSKCNAHDTRNKTIIKNGHRYVFFIMYYMKESNALRLHEPKRKESKVL